MLLQPRPLIYVLSLTVFGNVKCQTEIFEGCCYGDENFPHGSAVFSHPKRCFQIICQNGRLIPTYVNQKGDQNCCEFNGRLTPNGKELSGHCMIMKCEAGIWKPSGKIEDCCSRCSLYDDPHITTLDGTKYDWHSPCNYSVAQTSYTTEPDVGVFSKFQGCNVIASCLSQTTFRNDPNTIITLDHGDVTRVKGNGYENLVQSQASQVQSQDGKLPVLAWTRENCIFLMGSSKLLILHCPHRLDIWAHPFHLERLDGLCGHYNGAPEDDFTDRYERVHALSYWPMAFPHSWLAPEQSDFQCDVWCPECFEETTVDPCRAAPERRRYFEALCREPLKHLQGTKDFDHYMETCAFDLCAIYQRGGNETNARNWVRDVERMIAVVKDL
ncbi:mucin-6-like [Macrobrachium nipponense]|uniref:mucin-6-like n=1 Tax=Macrobrachium nipponense TaxID=159736 RepID=UPI0030C89A75